MIFFGKGNGNITINNLKNSEGHGPIKRIAFELSKLCKVILSDEFRTSKLCNLCEEHILSHPKTTHTKIEKKRDGKGYIKKEEKKVIQKDHGLCVCKNTIHSFATDKVKMNKCKIWNRDHNAATNILKRTSRVLLNQDLRNFSRKIKKEKIVAKQEYNEYSRLLAMINHALIKCLKYSQFHLRAETFCLPTRIPLL